MSDDDTDPIEELDDYIKEMFQSALDSIVNPDEEKTEDEKWEPLESLDQSPYGTLFDEKIVIKLLPKQVKFLDMYDQEGPDDEHFEDPSWDHCGNQTCEPCIVHALHHGINVEAKSIWEQCFEKFGDKDSEGTELIVPMLKAYSLKKDMKYFGKTVVFTPASYAESIESISGETYSYTQPKPKTKEEKPMKTIVGSKKRAEIILKAVERFDVSWNERGEKGFVNTLRVSPTYLNQFITTMLETLLKK